MKKIISILIALMFACSPAFAGVKILEDGAVEGNIAEVNVSTGLNAAVSGRQVTLTADPVDITSAVFEGATADAYETTLAVADPTADRTVTFADATGTVVLSTLATNAPDIVNSVYGGTNQLIMEGATANAYETIITPVDPTADRTVTLPNASGTVFLASAATALTPGAAVGLTVGTGNQLFTDTITTDNQDQTITFSGGGTAGDRVTIIFTTDTGGSGDEVITFHGTLCRSTGTLTLANAEASSYVVEFISNGTTWLEISRTAVQAAVS